jgi:hypothetical protein
LIIDHQTILIKSIIKSIKTILAVHSRLDSPKLKLRENYGEIYTSKYVSHSPLYPSQVNSTSGDFKNHYFGLLY